MCRECVNFLNGQARLRLKLNSHMCLGTILSRPLLSTKSPTFDKLHNSHSKKFTFELPIYPLHQRSLSLQHRWISHCYTQQKEIATIDREKLDTIQASTRPEPACKFPRQKAIRMINDLQKVLSVAFITFSMFSLSLLRCTHSSSSTFIGRRRLHCWRRSFFLLVHTG